MSDHTLYDTMARTDGSLALAHQKGIRYKLNGVFVNITGDINNLNPNETQVTVPVEVYGNKAASGVEIIGHTFAPTFTVEAIRNPVTKHIAQPWLVDLLDKAAVVAVLLTLLGEVLIPDSRAGGYVALAAALLNLARLARWRGIQVRSNSLLWVLHLAYLWVPVALALRGVSLVGASGDILLWSHAAGIGAISGMILAVMARAVLGHSGLPLRSLPGMWLAYLLINLAAGLRLSTGLLGEPALLLSLLAWEGSFALFLLVYWKVLLGWRDPVPAAPYAGRRAFPAL